MGRSATSSPCSTFAAVDESQHHWEAFEDVIQADTSTASAQRIDEEPRPFMRMIISSLSNVCVEARHNRNLEEIKFSPVSALAVGQN